MTTIEHVLVPTDGSEGARKAAAFAGVLARALDAQVSVLLVQTEDVMMHHAWGAGDYPAGTPSSSMPIDEVRGMLEQRIRDKELPDTASAVGELGNAPRLEMIWGHPAEEICRFAAEHAVDLIVIGSRGRSGFKRAFLGSVSHAVANHAPCPVTVVRE